MSDIQVCPICKNQVIASERYPDYVCQIDMARATDSNGKPVSLFNTSMGGGFVAKYSDGSEATEVSQTHTVYIDGAKYWADEAYMGGIVVTPLKVV